MTPPSVPNALELATEDQPAARVALASALQSGPSHAYLFAGPARASMAAAARAFAAELLADGADDPDSARARAMTVPSPHPDFVWLTPPGGQHLVDEVREQVIRSIAYRPFEGARRVFVIEDAEAMADESQNALLKTLEEPPPYAHLLLLSAEPAGLRATVTSRCQRIGFRALPPDAVLEHLRVARSAEEAPTPEDGELLAASKLAGGDVDRARFLVSEHGRALRAAVESCVRAVRGGTTASAPWIGLLEIAEREGEEAGREAIEQARDRAELSGEPRAKARATKEGEAAARRASRRKRTETLDLGLALSAAWFRDLAAAGEGAPELTLNRDRQAELESDAEGLDPRRARRAAELVLDTRRRLRVNVAEELALEALFYRAESLLAKP